jgi:outer membrane protein OmpA-like peptidoglycan-associated protein
LLSPGFALDLGPRGSTRPRIEASYDYAPGADVWRLSLAASAVFGRKAPEPEPVVEVPPPPPGTMVWLADPVCGWLDADAVLDATVAAEPSAWLDADGLRATAAASATAPEDRSNLVVAGWLGDRIEVDGQRVEMGEDGLAVVVRAPGPGEIRVVGGGRVEQLQIGVGNHQGLWFAVPPPGEVQIGFAVASARVDDVAKARLAEMAANAGAWGFEVRGGHSPEGDTPRNLALAVARAEAVAAELRALGVPTVRVAERIEVFDADAPPETLRVAIVTPIAGEAAP